MRWGEKAERSHEAVMRDIDSVVLAPNVSEAACAPEDE